MYSSLYIHVPFCQGGKCDYCAFYSLGDSPPELRQQYLSRLEEEFIENAEKCAPLRSIFIGGGTPSALTTEELVHLFEMIQQHFTLISDCEWTMEANPDSLTPDKLQAALEGGMNRLSLGVQSFQPHLRQLLGRKGTLDALPELIGFARKHGLKQLNFDLIYNIPGQQLSEWQSDLETALAFAPNHLSCYSLMFEEGTPLTNRLSPDDDDDDFFLQCWQHNDDFLANQGFPRYEISNFARPANRCRHNWEIWHGQTYLGCGPAAVSFDGEDRPANPSDLFAWLNHAPPSHDRLPPLARQREILAFGFRTVDGWPWNQVEALLGISRGMLLEQSSIQKLHEAGLLIWDETGIRPTRRGLLFNDEILAALL